MIWSNMLRRIGTHLALYLSKPREEAQISTSKSQFSSSTGKPGTFDNHIHQVKAVEETLSIHIPSDDAMKGEIFSREG
jgi:hypothetical protein